MRSIENPRATILLVEDDQALAQMLHHWFTLKGYRFWHAGTAAEARAMAENVSPDLIILDLLLPDRNGLVVCAELLEQRPVPIVILSATNREEDPILASKLGAVGFVPKPFSSEELEARVEEALRHGPPASAASPPAAAAQSVGPLVIDRSRCTVTLGGEVVHLTPTEYRLL